MSLYGDYDEIYDDGRPSEYNCQSCTVEASFDYEDTDAMIRDLLAISKLDIKPSESIIVSVFNNSLFVSYNISNEITYRGRYIPETYDSPAEYPTPENELDEESLNERVSELFEALEGIEEDERDINLGEIESVDSDKDFYRHEITFICKNDVGEPVKNISEQLAANLMENTIKGRLYGDKAFKYYGTSFGLSDSNLKNTRILCSRAYNVIAYEDKNKNTLLFEKEKPILKIHDKKISVLGHADFRAESHFISNYNNHIKRGREQEQK